MQDQTPTRWYHLIAYFFGGAFLANTIPHLVSGISGSPFQSPFASPPGQGLSSATVNVLWGMFNLVVAYVLVARVGRFELRQTRHVVVLGLGHCSWHSCWHGRLESSMGATSDQKPEPGKFVEVVQGELLDQDVDVIVNAWNWNIIPWWLLLPQRVSGPIKRRGGTGPFKELAKHGLDPAG